MTNQELLKKVKEENIRFIRLQFTDINGTLKNVEIPGAELEEVLEKGSMFDGSSIEGFARIQESDMFLKPDSTTFTILPWTKDKDEVGRLICNVETADGKIFDGDPRSTLINVVKELEKDGFEGYAGPEPEFFLLPRDEKHKPLLEFADEGGYFDLLPVDLGEETRKDIVEALEECDIEVEASHHEVAPSQHEIDFRYDKLVDTADDIQTFKLIVKTMAMFRNLHATFMPKPFYGINGSGMHCHMSLFRDKKNIFYDEQGEYQVSQELKWFIGGIFEHINAICAISNPTINSYKRLVPGYEAPINVAWSTMNRSALIRIPAPRKDGTRVELRCPDPAANPYLLLAVTFASGLKGIREKIDPPDSIDHNIYKMSKSEKRESGIKQLPRNLWSAVEALKQDDFIKSVLGKHIFDKFIALKTMECNDYASLVTDWETKRYLNL